MLPRGNSVVQSVKRRLRHYMETGQVNMARETLNQICRERQLDIDQYKQLLLDEELTGNTSMIKLLLEHDPRNSQCFQDKQPSALWLAVMYGYEKPAELLVRSGSVDLNERFGVTYQGGYRKEWTVLHALLWLSNSFWSEQFIALVVDHGADLEARDSRGRTPLHIAVSRSRVKMTELLLKNRADVNARVNEGDTALLVAVQSEKADELLPLLMRYEADVTVKDSHGCNVLYHLANADEERIDLVRVLIEKGADLENRNSKGQTVLHAAVARGYVKTIELLLEKGADVNVADNEGNTALLIAAQSSNKVDELVPLLMRHGADVTVKDAKGRNVLYLLTNADEERIDLATVLVEKGADFENRDLTGLTVLHLAAMRGHVKMIELLLQKGADVNFANNEGATPLLIAARNTRANESVPLLMKHGADVTARDLHGRSALHMLAISFVLSEEERLDVARLLIEEGVSPNDRSDECPLIVTAVSWERDQLVNICLDHGADVNLSTTDGRRLLHRAAVFENPRVLKTLLKRGASVDLRTNKGRTALHYACMKFRQQSIGMLLSAGADVLVEDKDGNTPFALIKVKNIIHPCIRQMLQKLALIRTHQPSIDLKDESIIEECPDLLSYYKKCLVETLKMKSMRLTDTDNVLDLLTKSHREISKLMQNRDFGANFKLHDLGVVSTYNAKHILRAYERAACHHRSWLKQQDMINEAVFHILPDVVVRKVLRYIFYDCCRSVK